MANTRIRITRRDDKGRYVSHNIKTFKEIRNELLRANRVYFFTPLVGYWRRKTLDVIVRTLQRMAI